MRMLRNGIAPVVTTLLIVSGCADLPVAPKSQAQFDNAQKQDNSQDVECRNEVITGPVGSIDIPPGYNCFITNALVSGDIRGHEPANVDISSSTVNGNIDMKDATGSINVRTTFMPDGNIDIKQGASVFITSVTIEQGSIVVNGGSGALNVQGSRSGFTVLADGGVDVKNRSGSILITSTAIAGLVQLRHNDITGTLQLNRNTFADLDVSKNTIAEFFMAVDQNRIEGNADVIDNRGPGNKRVQLNTVLGVLKCLHNDDPFVGGPNSAASAEGQCF